MVVTWRGWTDWSCVVPKNEPMNCACKFPEMPYLTLRGLCKDSRFERVYIPQNFHANGQLMYYGILKSRISYREEGWHLIAEDENTTALSQARKVFLLLLIILIVIVIILFIILMIKKLILKRFPSSWANPNGSYTGRALSAVAEKTL